MLPKEYTRKVAKLITPNSKKPNNKPLPDLEERLSEFRYLTRTKMSSPVKRIATRINMKGMIGKQFRDIA
jgi:hypothetical protein